jgi:hypothetical protein
MSENATFPSVPTVNLTAHPGEATVVAGDETIALGAVEFEELRVSPIFCTHGNESVKIWC